MFGVVDPQTGAPPVWVTPGGGVEGDEDIVTAACRELREETGLVVGPEELGDPVAVARGEWEFRGQLMYSDDWFFVVRRPAFELDTAGWTDLERELHAHVKWWTCDELDAVTENVFPGGLGPLVRDIVAGASFPTPVELPWTTADLPPMRRQSER